MTTTQASSSLPTNGINFIYKNQAGRMFFSLIKEISDSGGTNSNKHLDKIRTTDRKERHISFTGHGSGQQSLACSRSSNQ